MAATVELKPPLPGPAPRIATLVLVDGQGVPLGRLAPIEAATPWWQDMAPVVDAVRARDGLPVVVLRLLWAERPSAPGGAVHYLAQCDAPPPAAVLRPWHGALPDHPLRHAYARPGGPQADLAWAWAALAGQGVQATAPARQVRTWNLSSLWCLPTPFGEAWLKVVPPFFAHESAVLQALAAEPGGAPVPRLLARDGARALLAPVPGDDLYGADLPLCLAMVDLLVDLQAAWCGRCDDLARLGLPDWRGPALHPALAALVARHAAGFDAEGQAVLHRFVDGLPARFAAVADCGLPDGLVHGDLHPGNLRGGGVAPLTLLDWADSGIGHPLLDQAAFLDRIAPAFVVPARQHWAAAWRRHRPQARPERAAALLAPVASARQALIYQHFLDHIEPSEHPYHRADVPDWLGRTVQRLRAET